VGILYSIAGFLQTNSNGDSSQFKLAMLFRVEINPPTEHTLYLRLFITNGGGL
jgi:hypothetical protein